MAEDKKVKGVVDIVFLVDATGSMGLCIEDIKNNIGVFTDTLSVGDANNPCPVKDWRAKVVGFRDVLADGDQWFIDNPFVRGADAVRAQLAALRADGGGDEPESLMDALFRLANMGQTEKGAPEDAGKWRYKREAARVVIIFTDASFQPTMNVPEAAGGTFDDLNNAVTSNRILLQIFAPDLPCYDQLASIDKADKEPIPVSPGSSPVEALRDYTRNRESFQATLRALGRTVTQSAQIEVL